MALFRDSAFSPSANLHPDRSALVCTPVTLALRQLNSNPRLWLAWSAARQSCSATKDAHASVAFELTGKSPWACNFGVSFFSVSLLLPFESGEFFESLSFLTHLMGLSECPLLEPDEPEFPCAAVDAPAPAGPCAPARSAPTVESNETLRIRTATTKIDLFIVTPQWKIFGQGWGSGLSPSRPHQVRKIVLAIGGYYSNQSSWPFEQVPLSARKFLQHLENVAANAEASPAAEVQCLNRRMTPYSASPRPPRKRSGVPYWVTSGR